MVYDIEIHQLANEIFSKKFSETKKPVSSMVECAQIFMLYEILRFVHTMQKMAKFNNNE